MSKRGAIDNGSYGQIQAIWAHVWAKKGPKTAETRSDSPKLSQIGNSALNSNHAHAGPKMPLLLI
jgi:hypothetical protein